jgi:hypothetical protein
MSLYWYKYNALARIKDTSAYPGLEAWRSIYKAFQMILIDRRMTVRGPIGVSLDPQMILPDPSAYAAKTFEECCELRAQELLALAERSDKPLYLLFSGGLDSTTVAVAFLRACPLPRLRERLKIVTTTDAWIENPNFVRSHLVGTFEFISAYDIGHFYDGRALLVSGDPSEFGMFINQRLPAQGQALVDDMFSYLRTCGLSEAHARSWTDVFETERRQAPIEIATMIDWLWWIRFSWTWQYCSYHGLMGMNVASGGLTSIDEFHDRVRPFFGTTDFQVWAMMGNTDRTGRKKAQRTFIEEFTHDEEWTRTKKKFHSLHSVMRWRKRILGIDENFKPLYDVSSILKHYRPANDFI